MTNKAIVMTVWRRPWYLREVLDAWRFVHDVKEWDFIFHVDNSDQLNAQAQIITEWNHFHGNSRACLHQKTLGVALNPFHALSEAFKEYDHVVLSEEDVLPGGDVLDYFSWAQQFPELLAACAWSDGLGEIDEASRRKWFNPWLWQTNREMWESVIRPTWDMDYSTGDERGPGGWDCNLGLRVVNDQNLDVMFPHRSRSQHIGKWMGVHQDPNHHGEQEMPQGFLPTTVGIDWKEVPYVSG